MRAEAGGDRQRQARGDGRQRERPSAERRPDRGRGGACQADRDDHHLAQRNQRQVAEGRHRCDLGEDVRAKRRGGGGRGDRRRAESPEPAEAAPPDRVPARRAGAEPSRAERNPRHRGHGELQRDVEDLQRSRDEQDERGAGNRRARRRRAPDQQRPHPQRQHQRRALGGHRLAGQQGEERDRRERGGGRDRARVDVERKPWHARRDAAHQEEKERRHRRQMQPRDREDVGGAGGAKSLLDLGRDAAPIAEDRGLEEGAGFALDRAIDRSAQRPPGQVGGAAGPVARRLGQPPNGACGRHARKRLDPDRPQRQRRIRQAWVARPPQGPQLCPAGDGLAGAEVGPAVRDRQRQGATGRRAIERGERDDEARPARGLLGTVDDDRLDCLRIVRFDGRGERGGERRHPRRAPPQQAPQGQEQKRPGEPSAPSVRPATARARSAAAAVTRQPAVPLAASASPMAKATAQETRRTRGLRFFGALVARLGNGRRVS